jgi:hypothetical protein
VRRPIALVLALGAGALIGCAGIGTDDSVKVRVTGPALVTKKQLASLPEDSPARTVFEWWRTIQFDNPTLAVRYYSSELKITRLTIENQLQFGAASQNLNARPHLVGTDMDGDHATVNVLLENLSSNPNGRLDKNQTARAFNLVREDGEWKLAENTYLERGERIQRAFARAARLQAQGKSLEGESPQDEGAQGESPQAESP